MVAARYIGFSTVAKPDTLNTHVFDMELVKADLSNEFNTRLRSRVGRPFHGSIIWNLTWENFDDATEAACKADAERIISDDPRVEMLELLVKSDPDDHAITVQAKLKYIEFNMEDWFEFTFRNPN